MLTPEEEQRILDEKRLKKVVANLDKVNIETKQMIYNLSKQLSEIEIINTFNQQSLDFFNLCVTISHRMGKENEVKMGAYKNLYDLAIKANVSMQ